MSDDKQTEIKLAAALLVHYNKRNIEVSEVPLSNWNLSDLQQFVKAYELEQAGELKREGLEHLRLKGLIKPKAKLITHCGFTYKLVDTSYADRWQIVDCANNQVVANVTKSPRGNYTVTQDGKSVARSSESTYDAMARALNNWYPHP